MAGLMKTLFADKRTFAIAIACTVVTVGLLHTAFFPLAGLFLPLALLVGAVNLAKN